jgi:hypothetical protein
MPGESPPDVMMAIFFLVAMVAEVGAGLSRSERDDRETKPRRREEARRRRKPNRLWTGEKIILRG